MTWCSTWGNNTELDPKDALHQGKGTTVWSKRIDGMGVQEGRGELRIPLLFIGSTMTLGLTTEKIGTLPISKVVLHTIVMGTLGGVDLQTPCVKVPFIGIETMTEKWSYLVFSATTRRAG